MSSLLFKAKDMGTILHKPYFPASSTYHRSVRKFIFMLHRGINNLLLQCLTHECSKGSISDDLGYGTLGAYSGSGWGVALNSMGLPAGGRNKLVTNWLHERTW